MLYDPNWKSPDTDAPPIKRKDLSDSEIRALLWVREGLKSGAIPAKQFDMDNAIDIKRGCGTVGCIAGWMGMHHLMVEDGLSARQVQKYIKQTAFMPEVYSLLSQRKFQSLFYMRNFTPNPGNKGPTPEQGIEAIDRFLAGNKAPWGHLKGNKRPFIWW